MHSSSSAGMITHSTRLSPSARHALSRRAPAISSYPSPRARTSSGLISPSRAIDRLSKSMSPRSARGPAPPVIVRMSNALICLYVRCFTRADSRQNGMRTLLSGRACIHCMPSYPPVHSGVCYSPCGGGFPAGAGGNRSTGSRGILAFLRPSEKKAHVRRMPRQEKCV